MKSLTQFLAQEINRGVKLFFFKANCLVCAAPLVYRGEELICNSCLKKIEKYEGYYCHRCGKFSEQKIDLCGKCSLKQQPFIFQRSFAAYTGVLRKILLLYKYSAIEPLKKYLTSIYKSMIEEFRLRADFLMPMPHDLSHRNNFNHLGLIAEQLQMITGISVLDDLLIKQKKTPQQAGLSEK